jgi:glucosamine-6-phosphate isomerase
MDVKILPDYERLSNFVADNVLEYIKKKPDAVVCLASGDSPRLTYNLIAEKGRTQNINFQNVTFIGLDEWVGIAPGNPGSCKYFLMENIFIPLQLAPRQIHLFDGLSTNLTEECRKMDAVIRSKGGIDVMVVGIGMNGHIGFNEPGISPDLYSHVADLEETTKSVGQKYFKEQTKLEKGITIGLKYLTESKKPILIANGEKKAEIIRKAIEGPVTMNLPASIMQKHPASLIALDKSAASLLKK